MFKLSNISHIVYMRRNMYSILDLKIPKKAVVSIHTVGLFIHDSMFKFRWHTIISTYVTWLSWWHSDIPVTAEAENHSLLDHILNEPDEVRREWNDIRSTLLVEKRKKLFCKIFCFNNHFWLNQLTTSII